MMLSQILLVSSKKVSSSFQNNKNNVNFLSEIKDIQAKCKEEDQVNYNFDLSYNNINEFVIVDYKGNIIKCDTSSKIVLVESTITDSSVILFKKISPVHYDLEIKDSSKYIRYNSSGVIDCNDKTLNSNNHSTLTKINLNKIDKSTNNGNIKNNIVNIKAFAISFKQKGFVYNNSYSIDNNDSISSSNANDALIMKKLNNNNDDEPELIEISSVSKTNKTFSLNDIINSKIKNYIFFSAYTNTKSKYTLSSYISNNFCNSSNCNEVAFYNKTLKFFLSSNLNTVIYENYLQIEFYTDTSIILGDGNRYYYVTPEGVLKFGINKITFMSYFFLIRSSNDSFKLKSYNNKYLCLTDKGGMELKNDNNSNNDDDYCNCVFSTYDQSSVPQRYRAYLYFTIDDEIDYVKINNRYVTIDVSPSNFMQTSQANNFIISTGEKLEIRGHNRNTTVTSDDKAAFIGTLYLYSLSNGKLTIINSSRSWECNGSSPYVYGSNSDEIWKKIDYVDKNALWIWGKNYPQYSSCVYEIK